MSIPRYPPRYFVANNPHSLDDDPALQQKVNEALSVYDDYVKNKDGTPVDAGITESTNGEGNQAETTTA